jgi:hypothetical protein
MHSYAKYCSKYCGDKAYKRMDYIRKRKHTQKCATCGKEFITTSFYKIYCSAECRNKINTQNIKAWHEAHEERYKEKKADYCKKDSTKKMLKEKWAGDNGETKLNSIQEGVYMSSWTIQEDLYLIERWDKTTKKELAAELNRTIAAVRSRHIKLFRKISP